MSALSKRQQARHERALQQLLLTIPGNDRCADCGTKNPGVFLCMRCAALHRKMGTHISKVKSLSMDTWSAEQVDNMKKNGNKLVNLIYNPENVQPSLPLDMDDMDSVMERYIRQKYEKKGLVNGKSTSPRRSPPQYSNGYDSFDDEPAPPLPPKPKRFGFGLRSSSSMNLSSSSKMAPRQETSSYARRRAPEGSLTDLSGNTMEEKLEALRDLGFMDAKRNSTVLKGLDGNVDKAVEVLFRLGEGPAFPRFRTGAAASMVSRESTPPPKPPRPAGKVGATKEAPVVGISINNQLNAAATTSSQMASSTPTRSYNPFDPVPQQPQPTVSLEQSFQQMSLANPQQLPVPQPLFPNATGGYPNQVNTLYAQPSLAPPTPLMPQHSQGAVSAYSTGGSHNPFFQPTAPSQPQNYAYGMGSQMQPQPQLQPQQTGTNPFFAPPTTIQRSFSQPVGQSFGLNVQNSGQMSQAAQSQPVSTMPYTSSPTAMSASSPFSQPQPQQQQQIQPQQQWQQQPQPQPQQQTMQPQLSSYNPFDMSGGAMQPAQQQSYPQYQQQQQQPQQQPQPQPQPQFQQQQTYAPPRLDKNSILSLYQFSKPPPTVYEDQAQAQTQQTQQTQQPQQVQAQSAFDNQVKAPERSATMPALSSTTSGNAGSPALNTNNPFTGTITTNSQTHTQPSSSAAPASSTTTITTTQQAVSSSSSQPVARMASTHRPSGYHRPGQESSDLNAWQSGRHSPDFFATLSSRFA